MVPRGFRFSVAEAAIKRPGRNDLALIYSETDASAAAVFTSNRVKAAPVRLDMKQIRSGKARAVIVNSGNANAATGERGMRDAREMASLAGKWLGVPEGLVYVCSTGVIGVALPMDRIRPAIRKLAEGHGRASLEEAARAMMTTDTFPKLSWRKVKMGSRTGLVSGICKGAGMIAPHMATMLCFMMTDMAVDSGALKSALREAVEDSFNSITVDGDMSTNDTVIAMANGMAGNSVLTAGSRHFGAFKRALSEVAAELARMIVRDGEGATKLIEIEVSGAKNGAQAKKGAMALANSLLLKTAIYGEDPNVGRVMAAIGSSGIEMDEKKTDVFIGKVRAVRKGVLVGAEREARKELKGGEVSISVRLNSGSGRARVLTCDLTEKYVRINAEYTT
jgi:glutamate N-acetyltransferase/amino-acid N-acetyltransferase